MPEKAHLVMTKTEGRWFSLFRWIGGTDVHWPPIWLADSECEKYLRFFKITLLSSSATTIHNCSERAESLKNGDDARTTVPA